jgi:hypothetical protein
VADSSVDGVVEKGIIHSTRNESWLGLSLLLVREVRLIHIEISAAGGEEIRS